MNITTLAHVCIMTRDLDASSRFYCDTLGMKKQFNFTKNGSVVGFYLKASENTFIEFFLASNPTDSSRGCSLSHFCLETDSIESVRKKLVDAGYQPNPIKLGCDQSHQFWVKDPNGIEMEFHQYTKNSCQKTLKDVEIDW